MKFIQTKHNCLLVFNISNFAINTKTAEAVKLTVFDFLFVAIFVDS